MVKDRIPNTRAIMALKGKSVTFKPHLYKYQKDDVTKAAAREIGAPKHVVIKTVIMEDDAGNPLIVLMHGDRQVSTRALARALGAKSVGPVDTKAAQRLTGYLVGGISPFGTRRELPVYVEESILELPRLYINGGRRGLLIEMSPSDLVKVLRPTLVNVAI
jgi:Cys-tRNA(Pro) deacylase